jgi:hypothetical protein
MPAGGSPNAMALQGRRKGVEGLGPALFPGVTSRTLPHSRRGLAIIAALPRFYLSREAAGDYWRTERD